MNDVMYLRISTAVDWFSVSGPVVYLLWAHLFINETKHNLNNNKQHLLKSISAE